jgi:hypothetical protein
MAIIGSVISTLNSIVIYEGTVPVTFDLIPDATHDRRCIIIAATLFVLVALSDVATAINFILVALYYAFAPCSQLVFPHALFLFS